MEPLHFLPGNQLGLGKTILLSTSVGNTDQIRNLWEGESPRIGFTGKTHCTQVFQNSYTKGVPEPPFHPGICLEHSGVQLCHQRSTSPGVLPAQPVSVQMVSNDSRAAQHIKGAQWDGPGREQGWDYILSALCQQAQSAHAHRWVLLLSAGVAPRSSSWCSILTWVRVFTGKGCNSAEHPRKEGPFKSHTKQSSFCLQSRLLPVPSWHNTKFSSYLIS